MPSLHLCEHCTYTMHIHTYKQDTHSCNILFKIFKGGMWELHEPVPGDGRNYSIYRQSVRRVKSRYCFPLELSPSFSSLWSTTNGSFLCKLPGYIRKPGNVNNTHEEPTALLTHDVLLIIGEHLCSSDDSQAQMLTMTWSWLWVMRPFTETQVMSQSWNSPRTNEHIGTSLQQGCAPAPQQHGDPFLPTGFPFISVLMKTQSQQLRILF